LRVINVPMLVKLFLEYSLIDRYFISTQVPKLRQIARRLIATVFSRFFCAIYCSGDAGAATAAALELFVMVSWGTAIALSGRPSPEHEPIIQTGQGVQPFFMSNS